MRFYQKALIIALALVPCTLLMGINAKTVNAASLYEIIQDNAGDYLNQLESKVSHSDVQDFINDIDSALSGKTFQNEDKLISAATGIILTLAKSHQKVFDVIWADKDNIRSYPGFDQLYTAIKQKYLGAGATAPGGAGGALPVKKPEQPPAPLTPEKVMEELAAGKLTPEEAAAALAAGLDIISKQELPANYQQDLSDALAGIFAAAGKIDPEQAELTGDGQAAVVTVPEGALESQLTRMKALRTALTESLNKAGFAALTGGLPWQLTLTAPAAANRPQITFRLPARETVEIGTEGLSLRLVTPVASITLPPGALPAGAVSAGQETGAALELKIETPDATAAGKLLANLPAGEANRLTPAGKPLAIGFGLPETASAPGKAASFTAPLRLTFPFAKDAVRDPELLGVYVFNAEQNKWEYAGGEADPDQNLIVVKAARGGTFAPMEYRGDFRDLAGHWAGRDVRVMASRRLVAGTGPDTFSPDAAITRAEFTVILARMLGLAPAPEGAAGFTDVPAGAWYRGMVGAAAKAGLAAGTGPGAFGPDEPVTREQMAVMIARLLAKQKVINIQEGATAQKEAEKTLASLFRDAGAIAPWARAQVAQMAQEKILRGREADRFVPAGQSTRAEATVVLRRTLKKIQL